MKTGLVLEGGGMRGLYTAGVLDAFMETDFHADVVCGTSAGAAFGINLLSRQPGRVLRYNTEYMGDKRYVSLRSWLTTGNMVNTEFAYDLIPNKLDPFDYDAYRNSGTAMFATLTDTHTGRPEYVRIDDCHEQMDAIRASASLPFLSRKVWFRGKSYLDGGISDNIPLGKCREEGCDRIIVVLTHPGGYVKHENLYWISLLFYPFDRGLHKAFSTRDERYAARLREITAAEASGEIFVLRPSARVDVSRLEKDVSRLRELHALGLSDARAAIPAMRRYLER